MARLRYNDLGEWTRRCAARTARSAVGLGLDAQRRRRTFKENRPMQRLATLATILMMAVACGDSPTEPSDPNTGPLVFTASLSAANEVPPVTNAEANARGLATITMKVTRTAATGAVSGGGTVDFSVQLTGFPNNSTAILAHVHRAVAGSIGPVVLDTGRTPLTPFSLPTGTGTLTVSAVAITQALATEIAGNPAGFYFDVHSPINPEGVVRGQMVRQ
jgi:hypothetical protein